MQTHFDFIVLKRTKLKSELKLIRKNITKRASEIKVFIILHLYVAPFNIVLFGGPFVEISYSNINNNNKI
jgi:hypothetical protein